MPSFRSKELSVDGDALCVDVEARSLARVVEEKHVGLPLFVGHHVGIPVERAPQVGWVDGIHGTVVGTEEFVGARETVYQRRAVTFACFVPDFAVGIAVNGHQCAEFHDGGG